jgi:TolA-binding protein
MAKQRPQPKSKAPSSTTPAGRTSDGAHPERSTAYYEAVALYEKGIEALQRHEYDRAGSVLQSVLRQYPDEKELHERVRLYLSICERQAAPLRVHPRHQRRQV